MVSAFFRVGIMEPEYIRKPCNETLVVYIAWSDECLYVL